MPEKENKTCRRKGCGKQFTEEDNKKAGVCQYHPGAPFFHEGLKYWTCCEKKKFTDFTEFLGHPGCTSGQHSDSPEDGAPVEKEEKVEQTHFAPIAVNAVPRSQDPLIILPKKVSTSLVQALEKQSQEVQAALADRVVKPGQKCTRNACKAEYVNEDSDKDTCKHHPGAPVFHEGYKYWSCCKKKTTEFDEFLDQPGCEDVIGHQWFKPDNAEQKKCRYDWIQTPANVVITVFAKNCEPDETTIKANCDTLEINLNKFQRTNTFELKMQLGGEIDAENSKVDMKSTKVDIVLKKKDESQWDTLEK
eukprot:m.57335 g.57335  ORF g.57335 m.57335 type:complete len:305 (+) comp11099_c0_seq2:59-973(+)